MQLKRKDRDDREGSSQHGEEQDLTRRILTGARWASVFQFSGQAVSWLSTIIVVRFLTPADYGLFSMLEAPLELMFLFGILGLDVALVRARKIDTQALREAFGLLLMVGLTFFCVLFFGAPFISDYFKQSALEPLARAMAFIFLLLPFRAIPNALLDRDLQFKSRAKLELVSRVFAAATTLTMAALGAGFWALAVGLLVDRALYAVLVMVRHPWIVAPRFGFTAVRPLLAFGGMATAASATILVTSKGVSMISAPVMGATEFGIYVLATQFALLPLAKTMPILNPILVPAFARFRDMPNKAAQHLEEAIRIAAIILVPIMIGLSTLSDQFVSVVFGQNWHDAALPLALMSMVMPLRLVTLFLRSVITSFGRPDLSLLSSSIHLLVVLPCSYFAASHNLLALILLWVIAEPLTTLLSIRLAKQVIPFSISDLLRATRPSVIASAMMALTLTVCLVYWPTIYSSAAIQLPIGILIGAATYLGVLRLFFQSKLSKAIAVITGR